MLKTNTHRYQNKVIEEFPALRGGLVGTPLIIELESC